MKSCKEEWMKRWKKVTGLNCRKQNNGKNCFVFNIKGFILLKNREKREVIFMAGVITVERESVCMGDDLNAPNTTTVSINDEIL